MNLKRICSDKGAVVIVVCASLLGFPAAVLAHDAWLVRINPQGATDSARPHEPSSTQPVTNRKASAPDRLKDQRFQWWQLQYGHAGKLEAYRPEKAIDVQAIDMAGRRSDALASRVDDTGVVSYAFPLESRILALRFDNGFWSRAEGGKSVNLPKTENPGSTFGIHSVKHHKLISLWSVQAVKPIGQELELVPISASAPKAGDRVALRVLFRGKPAVGWLVGFDEYEGGVKTDADGLAWLTARAGTQMISTGKRIPVEGDPRYDQLSISANLVFEASAR